MQTASVLSNEQKLLAILGAAALFLAGIEYLIPKPYPFFRLGIANIPILLVITFMKKRDLFMLLFLKVFGQAIIHGTLLSYVFLFSVGGNIASLLIMISVRKAVVRDKISYIGMSLLGSLASNITQMLLAILLIYGEGGRFLLFPFVVTGTIGGLGVGYLVARQHQNFSWIREYYFAAQMAH